jgi:hypothetical protein
MFVQNNVERLQVTQNQVLLRYSVKKEIEQDLVALIFVSNSSYISVECAIPKKVTNVAWIWYSHNGIRI